MHAFIRESMSVFLRLFHSTILAPLAKFTLCHPLNNIPLLFPHTFLPQVCLLFLSYFFTPDNVFAPMKRSFSILINAKAQWTLKGLVLQPLLSFLTKGFLFYITFKLFKHIKVHPSYTLLSFFLILLHTPNYHFKYSSPTNGNDGYFEKYECRNPQALK